MIDPIDFQDKAVDWLFTTSIDTKSKQTMVMKSPTGSGKTIILIKYISKYLDDYNKNAIFIWLCPGKGDLEEQSRRSMNNFAPLLPTYDLQDALLNGFIPGSTTFINWEKITKKGNKAITQNERKNLFERIVQAHTSGYEFILIIDEEHSNNTAKAKAIIDYFVAKHIIRVSATTATNNNIEKYEIDEADVIDEGLITKAISVNEGITEGTAKDDKILLELADQKRKEILEKYNSIGKRIRPLVLIQFPNGGNEKIKDIEDKLNQMGYSRENKMVAAWLSGDKNDIPADLTQNDSQLAFLFIKQAINTGWDCPRAKILVKLREGGDEAFQIQTIGRIRRMPERKHYDINVLDLCYVYTFDEQYKIGLLSGLDKSYIPKRVVLKDKCKELTITKELKDMDGGTVDMREVFTKIKKQFEIDYNLDSDKEQNKVKLQRRGYDLCSTLKGSIISGVFTRSDDIIESINNVETQTPINTHEHGQLMRHTINEFSNILGIEQRVVRQIMDKLFSFKYKNNNKLISLNFKEYYAFILNNASLIKDELRKIVSEVTVQNRMIVPKTKDIKLPLEDFYHYDEMAKDHTEYESSAYKGYNSAFVTSNCGKSDPEILFEHYCEQHKDKLDWAYKNGDSGQEYLSIVYYNGVRSKQKLFYPDYILKNRKGEIWIIETKGGQKGNSDQNIDIQILNKFETFKRYANDHNLHWGFVRPMNMKLYLNNTEYTRNLRDDKWIPLDDIFNQF